MNLRDGVIRFFKNCWRVIKYSSIRYVGDQLAHQSVALTYYTLFSIVPLVALVFGITRGFELDFSLADTLTERYPAHKELFVYVCEMAQKTLHEASGGVVAGVGVIALLWTVVWLINNVERAFNVVWGLPPRRNILRKFSSYLSLVLLTPIMMVAITTVGAMLRNQLTILSNNMEGNVVMRIFWSSIASILPIIGNALLLWLIYMRVPNTKVRWKGALAAALIIGIMFQVLQDGFIFLQTSVFSYNRIYGGFAALPLFLIWVNWSWQLILFGAEISFVHQHLKSGVFRETQDEISKRLRLEHQLAIIRLVCVNFQSGAGPTPVIKISESLCVPDGVLRSEIGELVDCGILCRMVTLDGDLFLLPGIPPEKLTVIGFLRIISGAGDVETPELARFEEFFRDMEKAIENGKVDRKIYEV